MISRILILDFNPMAICVIGACIDRDTRGVPGCLNFLNFLSCKMLCPSVCWSISLLVHWLVGRSVHPLACQSIISLPVYLHFSKMQIQVNAWKFKKICDILLLLAWCRPWSFIMSTSIQVPHAAKKKDGSKSNHGLSNFWRSYVIGKNSSRKKTFYECSKFLTINQGRMGQTGPNLKARRKRILGKKTNCLSCQGCTLWSPKCMLFGLSLRAEIGMQFK